MSDNKPVRKLPFTMFQGILPLKGVSIPTEIIAGITLASIAIPQVMGYTRISGTPVITGLYTLLVPASLFAIFGSSRHLVVGADSATAAILASGLAAMAISGPQEYMALAGMLALMAAALLLTARFFKLGFLANFLSRSVLIGFLTGVGIQVTMGEFPGVLGITIEKSAGVHTAPEYFWYAITHLSQINIPSLLLALAAIAFIAICSKISKLLPGPLLAVTIALFAAWYWDFPSLGIRPLGELPSGLPSFHLPDFSAMTLDRSVSLLSIAISMFVVILAQSAATSRSYAERFNERFDEDTDLVGLAFANIGASLSGTFVVNGSPTMTEIHDSNGGRTQLTQIASVMTVLVVLLFLTKPMAVLPEIILSVIVFLIGFRLIDGKGMVKLYNQARAEFWIALVTAAIVIIIGVMEGILFAFVASLLDHVRSSYRPLTYVLARDEKNHIHLTSVKKAAEFKPGLVVYSFTHSLYYANAQAFEEDVESIKHKFGSDLKILCIQAAAISDVDFSAAQMLKSLIPRIQAEGIEVVFAFASPHVTEQMRRYGFHDFNNELDYVKMVKGIAELLGEGAQTHG